MRYSPVKPHVGLELEKIRKMYIGIYSIYLCILLRISRPITPTPHPTSSISPDGVNELMKS